MNPGCPSDNCNNDELITLIHVRADGDNDTLHYIWDFNRQPSILVALTELNTNVTIKWDQFSNDANLLTFSNKPKYTMSFILTKVSGMHTRCTHYFSPFFMIFLLWIDFHLQR